MMNSSRLVKQFCLVVIVFVVFCEILGLVMKPGDSLQYEINLRKIDIMKDKEGVIQLLPGVGVKKVVEIIAARKEAKDAKEVIEKVRLSKKLLNDDSLVDEN